ncbi:MAG: hypothetical protein V7646_5227 [Pseudonocardia sp.]
MTGTPGEGRHARRPFPRVLAPVLMVPVLVLADAGTAWAQSDGGHNGGHGGVSGGVAGTVLTGPMTVTLGVAALVASALVAGAATLHPFVPPSRSAAIAVEAGAAAAVAVLVIGWLGGGMTAFAAFPQAVGVVAVAVLFVRGPRLVSASAGVLLSAALAYGATLGRTGGQVPVAAAHIVAAVLWLGTAVLVAAADGGARRALLRRLAPVASGAATVFLTTAVLTSADTGLRLDAVSAGSAPGLVAGLMVLFVAAAAALGAAGLRGTGQLQLLPSAAAVVVVLAVVSGAVITVLPPPARPAETGRPLLRTVALGGQDVPVVVVPQRPGLNLVHVGTQQAVVDGLPVTERAGAPGGWAVVDLPAGTGLLTIESGDERVQLRLDLGPDPAPPALVAGLVGPDGPECLSAVLGAVLAATAELPVGCPADVLSPADAAALRATVRFLADRGVPALHLVADGSPRSAAATAAVRDAAATHGVPLVDRVDPVGAVVVLSGWEGGGRSLIEEAIGLSTVGGTYTAPWLATGPVLGRQTGAVTTLVFDPRDGPAQHYLADLRVAGTTALASPAGFRTWSAAAGEVGTGPGPRIFAAVQVSVMPAGVGGMDHRATDRWLPGGAFTPVTPPLPW